MHDDTFLLEFLTMQVYMGVGSSDHFPIVLKCTHQNVNGFRSLLERQPLRFNSSFLGHDKFKHVMGQLVGEFTNKSMSTVFRHGIFVFPILNDLHDIMVFIKHPSVNKR